MSGAVQYKAASDDLLLAPRRWLVTGAAGFIGSHLCEELLRLGQEVIGLDNLATGSLANIETVKRTVGDRAASRFRFITGDICDPAACETATEGVELVLHQAALGSVPRSIEDPVSSNRVNVGGFLEVLLAASRAGVKRVVYASSSSVYGDAPGLKKVEHELGRPLSPYAASKRADELYADSFGKGFGLETIGLRYFNVFGPRQNPEGPYAAVIPRWLDSLARGEAGVIFGDGETSRDFCYVANVVQANILAAVAGQGAVGQVFNIAVGESTSLQTLYATLAELVSAKTGRPSKPARFEPFRKGDVRQSLADITLAEKLLGYSPTHALREGLELLVRAA